MSRLDQQYALGIQLAVAHERLASVRAMQFVHPSTIEYYCCEAQSLRRQIREIA